MAELVFNIPDVSMTATWTIAYRRMSGSIFYGDLTGATGASSTKSVVISGIPSGENVKRAMLTATISVTGDTGKIGSSQLTINN